MTGAFGGSHPHEAPFGVYDIVLIQKAPFLWKRHYVVLTQTGREGGGHCSRLLLESSDVGTQQPRAQVFAGAKAFRIFRNKWGSKTKISRMVRRSFLSRGCPLLNSRLKLGLLSRCAALQAAMHNRDSGTRPQIGQDCSPKTQRRS